MSEHLKSQGAALIDGINAFEPYIDTLHKAFKGGEFFDWPTVVLATTLQTSAISLFRLLPTLREQDSWLRRIVFSKEKSREPLDVRSIASIVRNIVDTHDAVDMFLRIDDSEIFGLHRDILSFYLAGRIGKVQSGIDKYEAQEFYKNAPGQYWQRIKESPAFVSEMQRLKNGESIYYETRRVRVEKVCGKDSDFVLGVLTDLSTYVHSIPPAIWMSQLSDIYTDNQKNRDIVAIWLRIANVYYAHSIKIILNVMRVDSSYAVALFLDRHKQVFQD